jgi:class 3 adenylate cyclase
LPAGTLTFLLTDIEGSSRLWESEPEAMEVALQRHDRLLAEVIESHGGAVVTSRGEGDSFFAVFHSAVSAVEAAGMCQLRSDVKCGLPVVLCGCGWGCIPGRCGCAAAIISTTPRSIVAPG